MQSSAQFSDASKPANGRDFGKMEILRDLGCREPFIWLRLLSSVLVFSCVLAFPATAQPKADPLACTAIADFDMRLECFNSAFLDSEEAPPEVTYARGFPQWSIRKDLSSFSDEPRVIGFIRASNVSSGGFSPNPVSLILRCADNVTSLVLSPGGLLQNENVIVRSRLGKAEVQSSRWLASTNREGVGLWTASTAVPFIKSLKNNAKLVVKIEDRQQVEATFDLGNVDLVVQEVRAACDW